MSEDRVTTYQVIVNGRTCVVGDLTKKELQQALCDTIDALEDMDESMHAMTQRMRRWRNGETE